MATFLDIGILEYFVPVFIFLLVFGILFAILEKTHILGDNRGMNSLVAFALSFLFILTSDLVKFIQVFTPWVVILFIFLIVIVLLFMFVGVKADSIAGAFSDRGMIWIIIMIFLIVFIYAMTQVYGSDIHGVYGDEAQDDTGALNESIGKIIFHPKMLGVAVILVIAGIVVRLIAQGFSPK